MMPHQVRPPGADQTESCAAIDALIVACVVAIASIFAAAMLAAYAADPGQLWQSLGHDRNGHFSYGLDLALAVRDLDLVDTLSVLSKSQVWPPVHGMALASVLLLGGIDVRLAIVPSLIGWTSTIVLTFLIARRLFAGRLNGNVAGLIAVSFALASPSFRLITADVMLEGLGAMLSAFCVYAYVRARAEPDSARWWGTLAVGLTFLFFEKGNYWMLTAVPLGIAFFTEDLTGWLAWVREQLARFDIRAGVGSALRDPFLITAIVLVGMVSALYSHGPSSITVFGRQVSLYPPENLVTVVWWVLFIRATMWWNKFRAPFDATIGVAGRRLFYWHLVPIAVSFLLPKRLSVFLWYVGPTREDPEGAPGYNPAHALVSQWDAFSHGSHVAPWAAVLVVAFAGIAAVSVKKLGPGGRAILLIAVLSAIAVVIHPMQQWRFQASWLFAVWVLAGAGGAIALSLVTSRLPTIARVVVAAAMIAAIAVGEYRQGWEPSAYPMATHPNPGQRASDLDLARLYLPQVRGLQKVGFITTFPKSSYLAWTLREACRCRVRVETPWLLPALSREQYRQATAAWLRETPLERIVVIDSPSLFPIPGYLHANLAGQIEALEQDGRFERLSTDALPALDTNVSVWRRRS